MKKQFILVLAATTLSVCLNAQVKVASQEAIKAFLNSKTYVVLEENPFSSFNGFINEQIKKIWKITPVEIINYEEFEKKMGDPKNSFLYVSQATFSRTKTSLFSANTGLFDNNDVFEYIIISLAMGDPSKNINKMPDLCIVPVAYAESEQETFDYKFGALIKFIGWYLNYSKNNPGKDIQQLVKENKPDIKNHELWLVREELETSCNTAESIKKIYPWPFRLVNPDEIRKAIEEGMPNVAFLHKVGPNGTSGENATCWNFIITASEGKPLYFSHHKINKNHPDAFLESDFRNLAE